MITEHPTVSKIADRINTSQNDFTVLSLELGASLPLAGRAEVCIGQDLILEVYLFVVNAANGELHSHLLFSHEIAELLPSQLKREIHAAVGTLCAEYFGWRID